MKYIEVSATRKQNLSLHRVSDEVYRSFRNAETKPLFTSRERWSISKFPQRGNKTSLYVAWATMLIEVSATLRHLLLLFPKNVPDTVALIRHRCANQLQALM